MDVTCSGVTNMASILNHERATVYKKLELLYKTHGAQIGKGMFTLHYTRLLTYNILCLSVCTSCVKNYYFITSLFHILFLLLLCTEAARKKGNTSQDDLY